MKHEQTQRVFVFTTSYIPFLGGAEIAIKEITKRAVDLRFLIITSRYSGNLPRHEQSGNVEILRLGFGTKYDKWLLPILGFLVVRKMIAHKRICVLWGMMISQGTLAAYFLKKWYPHIPFVVSLQEGDSEQYLAQARFGLIQYFWKRVLNSADGLTAISNYLADIARRLGWRKEVAIIPNAVDENFVSKSYEEVKDKEIKNACRIKDNERVIISVSRLVEKNGIGDLVESLKYLENVKFLLIGDGELRDDLEKRAKKEGVADQIIFLGTLANEDIWDYLRIADVFVRPSLSEGLGISFLEAMGAGVPIVATPVGGIVDFLIDHKNGIFVRPRDSKDIARGISEILDNVELKKKLIEAGRKIVIEKYMWVDVAKKMEMFLRKYL